MRKFFRVNLKSIFMWVITFALTLVISMGGAYAYFTATASKKQSEMTTGIIRVGLTDTQLTASNSGSSSSTKILPGSTIKYSGKVQNTGNTDMYAVLEFSVYIEGTEDPIQTTYYSAAGTKLVYSDSKQEFVTVGATQIAAGAFQHFELNFKFDSSLDNRYKTKTATVIVTAHAIQYRNIENAVQAVNLLLSNTGGGVTRLPSNYTQLQYVEADGNQWFDTDFQVTTDTDNFIIETSIKWTNTTKRQLMGYSGATGYFGIKDNGNYDFGYQECDIKASTTSYDNLRVMRNKTNSIWSLYVNNILAYDWGEIDGQSGFLKVGALANYSSFNCYCQMKYFKIYQDGELKLSLIPAKNSEGVAGMYDTVNNKFYISTSGTAFIAGGAVTLPSEYTRLEYIESTGTQYIDTGYIPNANSQFDVTFLVNEANSKADCPLFGARASWSNSYTFWCHGISSDTPTSGFLFNNNQNNFDSFKLNVSHNVYIENGSYRINGATSTFTKVGDGSPADTNLILFGLNNGGNSIDSRKFIGYVYNFKISENNVLIRNFVPVKHSNGTIGLFDTVTNTFFANLGSGTFVAGPAA